METGVNRWRHPAALALILVCLAAASVAAAKGGVVPESRDGVAPTMSAGRVLHGASSGRVFFGYDEVRLALPSASGGTLTFRFWNDQDATRALTNRIRIAVGTVTRTEAQTTHPADRTESYTEYVNDPNRWGPAGGRTVSVTVPAGVSEVVVSRFESTTGIEISEAQFEANADADGGGEVRVGLEAYGRDETDGSDVGWNSGYPAPSFDDDPDRRGRPNARWRGEYRIEGDVLRLFVHEFDAPYPPSHTLALGYRVTLDGTTFEDGTTTRVVVLHRFSGSPDRREFEVRIPIRRAVRTGLPTDRNSGSPGAEEDVVWTEAAWPAAIHGAEADGWDFTLASPTRTADGLAYAYAAERAAGANRRPAARRTGTARLSFQNHRVKWELTDGQGRLLRMYEGTAPPGGAFFYGAAWDPPDSGPESDHLVGWWGTPERTATVAAPATLDLNRATVAQLMAAGISPAGARTLVGARIISGGFADFEDALQAPGLTDDEKARLRRCADVH